MNIVVISWLYVGAKIACSTGASVIRLLAGVGNQRLAHTGTRQNKWAETNTGACYLAPVVDLTMIYCSVNIDL